MRSFCTLALSAHSLAPLRFPSAFISCEYFLRIALHDVTSVVRHLQQFFAVFAFCFMGFPTSQCSCRFFRTIASSGLFPLAVASTFSLTSFLHVSQLFAFHRGDSSSYQFVRFQPFLIPRLHAFSVVPVAFSTYSFHLLSQFGCLLTVLPRLFPFPHHVHLASSAVCDALPYLS